MTEAEVGAACVLDALQGEGWETVDKREKGVGIA